MGWRWSVTFGRQLWQAHDVVLSPIGCIHILSPAHHLWFCSLGCQSWEWTHFIHGLPDGHGGYIHAGLASNPYGPPDFAAFFFFITGFHGFHVFSGVCFNFLIYYNTAVGVYERRGHYEMI